jgi:hypothetical protein|eukprot:COSAG06_NODE_34104_length_479_cov_1.400000_2_plen_106_part_00
MLTELREELRRRGAPTHGRYEDLVARLDALVVAEVEADHAYDDDDGVGGLSREPRPAPHSRARTPAPALPAVLHGAALYLTRAAAARRAPGGLVSPQPTAGGQHG